ncbi:hypothetical protein C943_01344 [Mariniradius saccharolyticus AK6]|uniref:asparagine synthase (glutamine-hydrolyzing) n=1 Tax=Mariniradius saccharolyticus AK6 TaxID=1239962 RepID=M7XUA6_9BACT|nr:hypothetical protein [Mariniradius saccharolyticus]EMS32082.1 hypothetical protein C943_01344 [Mariniradius saccharolyticus AK6]
MSKIIWVYSRKKLKNDAAAKLDNICSFLTPDNLIPNPHKIHLTENCGYGILNPKANIVCKDNSVLMGVLNGGFREWQNPGSEVPDGNFAIFRSSATTTEIISDSSGSRTIWYFFDNDLLIASTSQFAIIKYVSGFEFNRNVIPWMLTTGTLGPDNSWDKRIKKMPPNTVLKLDHLTWNIELRTDEIPFGEAKNSEVGFEKMDETLKESFRLLNLSSTKWVLPLSGGYDSRGILFYLISTNQADISTITWGLPGSRDDKKSDAYIAEKLSSSLNVPNLFLDTDFSDEPFAVIFERFIKNGEGRIDHISGYLDGFKIWSDLNKNGIDLIIRGDENFGWLSVNSPKDVLTSLGISFFYEYPFLKKHLNMQDYIQELPESLSKKENETLHQWRDRLYHQYRLQNLISSLGDLKYSYVEQIVPLLTRKVLQTTYQLSDKNRTDKILWKSIVESFNPKFSFATSQAIASVEKIYHSEKVVTFLKGFLSENLKNEIFEEQFMIEVLQHIKFTGKKLGHSEKMTFRKIVKILIPSKIYSLIKDNISVERELDWNLLAMRISLTIFIYRLLKDQ